MVTEAVLLLAGLAGTLGVGLPLASALASPHRWRSMWAAERGTRHERERVEVTPGYKPLDLGPDLTRWPSERAWPTTTTLREPQWPSRSWNDEHFGSHWRNNAAGHVQDRGFHAMASRAAAGSAVPASSVATPPRPPPRPPDRAERGAPQRAEATEDSWFQNDAAPLESAEETRRRATEQRRRQQQSGTTQDAKRRQQQVALEQARKGSAPKVQQRPPRAAPEVPTIADPRPRGRAAPERVELERLIETVGLAGTVQAIMDRTGWEFREAANYLAKIRSSR